MLYLIFAIFSVGTGMLQSSHIRATKGVVATRRRITYAVIAAPATAIEVLGGAITIPPPLIGALLCFPIFYVVHTTAMKISLRLRYTFRIGLALVLLTIVPLIIQMKPYLQR
jgi:hypothetical protein